MLFVIQPTGNEQRYLSIAWKGFRGKCYAFFEDVFYSLKFLKYLTISLFDKYFSWNCRWCSPTTVIVTSNLIEKRRKMVCKTNRELVCILTLGISFMLLFAADHTMINMQVC